MNQLEEVGTTHLSTGMNENVAVLEEYDVVVLGS